MTVFENLMVWVRCGLSLCVCMCVCVCVCMCMCVYVCVCPTTFVIVSPKEITLGRHLLDFEFTVQEVVLFIQKHPTPHIPADSPSAGVLPFWGYLAMPERVLNRPIYRYCGRLKTLSQRFIDDVRVQ